MSRVTWQLMIALLAVLMVSAPLAAQELRGDGERLRRERPALLLPLYATFVGLQAVDVHSTMSALDNGARESNPLVRGALGSPAGMLALKTASAAGAVLLTEKLWPHNRAAAVITMIALNGAYASIATHNYRLAR